MGYTILWLLVILSFNSTNQQTGKNIFNPPLWIIGKWSNSAVSNTENTGTFIFQKHNIIFSQGLFSKMKQIDFSRKYSFFKVSEVIDSLRYKIILKAGNRTLEYEFMKAKLGSYDRDVLSYSIKENNRVIKQHSDSINRVLYFTK
jgi:hypothetical protein